MKTKQKYPKKTTLETGITTVQTMGENGVVTVSLLKKAYNLTSPGVKQAAAEHAGCKLPNFLKTSNNETIKDRLAAIEVCQAIHVQDSEQRLNKIKSIRDESRSN